MKHILILGGSGFIGHALYKELQSYYDTHATYYSAKGFQNNCRFHAFSAEEEGLEPLLKKVKPKLIISCLRGDFEALLETHHFLVEFIKNNDCRMIFISSANVFDTFENYPSYEYDKTFSESVYGRFKIKIENDLLRLPVGKYVIARIPMIFGLNAPRTLEIDQHVHDKQPIEVFPNTIININSINRLCQQLHYIINQKKTGIFHLGSSDLISHFDFIKAVVARRHYSPGIFKHVYTSNRMRYLAVLPKENPLPPHLRVSYNEVLDDLSLIQPHLRM